MPIVVNTPALSPDLTCSPWATTGDLCDPCSTATIDPPLLLRCLAAASDVLFMLSGRQYTGQCDDYVRPCAKPIAADHGRPIRQGFWPWGAGVGWTSGPWQGATSPWGFCLCNRTERAGGYTVAEVPLPGYPVTGVSSVKVDGVELAAGVDYRVDDDRYLVRLPDPTSGQPRAWPCCQRTDLPDTEPGTWSVAYSFGRLPPPSGVLAAAELGCQLALALTPAKAGECRLPKRVTSIARQGVSAVVLDPMAFLEKGKTGLYDVDLFLAAVNRNGLNRRARAWHPEMGQRADRRTNSPAL